MERQKRCQLCRIPLTGTETGSLRRWRCPSCDSSYQTTIRKLKKANPLPDNHSCACCGKSAEDIPDAYVNRGPKPTRVIAKFCLDHDHVTGEFRGWLCAKCNSALGLMQDSPTILRKAIEYLETTRQPAKDCPVCISAITKCMFCP